MTDLLSLPASPAFTQSRFGLMSNTQLFRSPLTGQTQTVEQPGARWQAEYRLPPMKRAQMAEWQSFLLKLRGGSGLFYACDPDARTPRGSVLMDTGTTRNEVRNGDARGAVTGVIGSGGSAPTNWAFTTGDGVTREIVGTGVEAGVSYVDVRFSGTPTANFTALNFETTSQVAVAEGEVWTASYFYRLAAGSVTNLAALMTRLAQIQAGVVDVEAAPPVLLDRGEDADDRRVVEVRQRHGAAEEAAPDPGVVLVTRVHQLDGDDLPGLLVDGAPHRGDPALAELPGEAVATSEHEPRGGPAGGEPGVAGPVDVVAAVGAGGREAGEEFIGDEAAARELDSSRVGEQRGRGDRAGEAVDQSDAVGPAGEVHAQLIGGEQRAQEVGERLGRGSHGSASATARQVGGSGHDGASYANPGAW